MLSVAFFAMLLEILKQEKKAKYFTWNFHIVFCPLFYLGTQNWKSRQKKKISNLFGSLIYFLLFMFWIHVFNYAFIHRSIVWLWKNQGQTELVLWKTWKSKILKISNSIVTFTIISSLLSNLYVLVNKIHIDLENENYPRDPNFCII